jgi:hypothetical protein
VTRKFSQEREHITAMNLLSRPPTCSKQFVTWAHLGHGAKQSSICRLVGLQVKLSPWRAVGFLATIFSGSNHEWQVIAL